MKKNNEIDIVWQNIEKPGWMKNVEILCHEILGLLEIKNWELSLVFCDDSLITELNEKFRKKPGPTDILSFPMEKSANNESNDRKIMAGDVVISVDTLVRNAVKYGCSREMELKRLLIHGILHLKGMDHDKNDTAMLDLQEKILNKVHKEGS